MSKRTILLLIIGLFFVGAYYIWTLMVRLNNEVTDAFKIMNEKLIIVNTQAENRLDSLYVISSQTDFSHKTDSLKVISTELDNYLESLKEELLKTIGENKDYQTMSGSKSLDSLFFTKTGYTKKGQEFLDKIITYEKTVKSLFGDDIKNLNSSIENMFYRNRKVDDWLSYHFKGFPLVAALTKLTQMQADISALQEKVLLAIQKVEE